MPTMAIHDGHALITYVNPALSRVPIKGSGLFLYEPIIAGHSDLDSVCFS